MKTIDFSYFIERYIAGEMDKKEELWFLKEMEGNPELKHEVELRRKTDNILVKKDILDLRRKLTNIENTRINKPTGEKPGRMKYAALIALLIIIGGIAFIYRGKLSNEEILERYYKAYEPTSNIRSDFKTDNQDFNLALEYYKVRDYRNAAVYFSKVIQAEPGNMHSTLLNGISNYEISNYPEAENSFTRIIDDNNNLFIDHAQWYLALCYLKTNDILKAKEQFIAIDKSGSIYKKNARQILKRLK